MALAEELTLHRQARTSREFAISMAAIISVAAISIASFIAISIPKKIRVVKRFNVHFNHTGTSKKCRYEITDGKDSTEVKITSNENHPFPYEPNLNWEAKLSNGSNATFHVGLEFDWDMETLTAFKDVDNYGEPETVVEGNSVTLVRYIWNLPQRQNRVEIKILFQIRDKNNDRILAEKRHSVVVEVLPVQNGE